MKMLVATFVLAGLLGPAIAMADQNAAAPSAQMQSHMAQFQQVHARMEQIHQQARTQILATLTPAQKTQLANVTGQLAVAANPNPEAAARQLNAMLTPGQRQSVLRIAESAHAQMRSVMQQLHAQMGERGEGHPMPPAAAVRPMPDAGHILLMLSGPGPHGMMMHHGM